MANSSALKDVPEHVTMTVNTQALLTWLRFGTTDPPLPPAPAPRNLRKLGRVKATQLHPSQLLPKSARHKL